MHLLWPFRHYPMGPNLRAFLGLDEGVASDAGDEPVAQADDVESFSQALCDYFETVDLPQGDELASIFEELVLMMMPSVVLRIAKLVGTDELSDDFRCCLAIGSAAMMNEDLGVAETFFRFAQAAVPEELAPYKNLCEIFYRQDRDDELVEWSMVALQVDPNAPGIWELLGAVYFHRYGQSAGEVMLRLAKEKMSWAGLSLAAQYASPTDPLFRAQLLEEIYASGLRDERFLVEYTAALGVALQYERIPPIVWEFEKFHQAPGESSSWELFAHAAQAYLAQEQHQLADVYLNKALTHPKIPKNVFDELNVLKDEVKDRQQSVGNQVIH